MSAKKNKLPQPKERDIQKAILDWLRFKRIFSWKQNTVGIKKLDNSYIPASVVGVPDILGVLPRGRHRGMLLALEVKREGNHPTEAQKLFLGHLRASGAVAEVVHSLDEAMAVVVKAEQE